jgi:hypothetical protein
MQGSVPTLSLADSLHGQRPAREAFCLALLRGYTPFRTEHAKNLLDETRIIQRPALLFEPEAYTLQPLTIGLNVKTRF